MVARVARKSARRTGFELDSLVRAGLDTLDFGFAIFDRSLALVASNKAFRTLRGYPAALCRPGTALVEFYRFNAKRGDYGPGDAEAHAQVRLARVRTRKAHDLEYALASGRILGVRYRPIADGGLVLAYADITARKRAEQEAERREAELEVALDNMPGALVYTDESLDIVVCNDRFAEMYPVPKSLLRRGRPYPDVPAAPGGERILRTRRCRRACRHARREPAQSHGQDFRGPHTRRPSIRGVSSPRCGRGDGDGHHRRHQS